MSGTLVEQARALQADVEQAVRNIVNEMQNRAKSQKGLVYQNHRINDHLSSIQQKSQTLYALYEDVDGNFKAEVDSFTGDNNIHKVLNSFDTRLSDIREYHKNYSTSKGSSKELVENEECDPINLEFRPVEFAGEEAYGKYFDLHESYQECINLKPFCLQVPPIDYAAYLNTFYHFHKIEKQYKDETYKKYLEKLLLYVADFYKRVLPLSDVTHIMEKTMNEFEENWSKGQVIGWEQQHQQEQGNNKRKLDDVKNEDAEMEKDTSNNNKKKQRKNRKKKKVSSKTIAVLEAKIARFVDIMEDVLESTKKHVEKKYTRTYDENMAEMERAEEMEDLNAKNIVQEEEQEAEDKTITNPLNLPVGWDGKPIPYWLYKLNGLNQEFKCEICGNYSYWGPRAFEKHFQEWRHAHGMRCLKIPNTRHFHHITKIAEALELWDNLKKQMQKNQWKVEAEEFEDENGNVFNKKTMEDLQKQGINFA